MEAVERMPSPPLARRIGDTLHVSSLLQKVCRLSGLTEAQVGEWLLKCAVLRGAGHYEREFTEGLPSDYAELTDEELGIALCLGHHSYNSAYIRAAAQLLSSPAVNPRRVARLALMERVDPVMLYIARIAARFEPALQPWADLLRYLPQRVLIPPDALPHWSRFVSQTGVTPNGGGPDIKWLKRDKVVK